MNVIQPTIVNVVMAPSNDPLYLQISPGNWWERPVKGVFEFVSWNDVVVQSNNSLLLVEKTGVGEVRLTSVNPNINVLGDVSFTASIGFLDGNPPQTLTGKTHVEFLPETIPTGLVAFPAANENAIVYSKTI
jgi:hypothetical protein